MGGTVIDLDPETHSGFMPTARRYTWPKEVFRYKSNKNQTAESSATKPTIQPLGAGLLLVLENTDPRAHNTEPIFGTD